MRQRDVLEGTPEIGAVRARLARIAWVGVVVVVIVLALLAYFGLRYATTVDTMRAWAEADGTVTAEIAEARGGRVTTGQAAEVRIGEVWYSGVVREVGANPVVAEVDHDLSETYRYVRLRIALTDGADAPAAGAPAEVRMRVGWPW